METITYTTSNPTATAVVGGIAAGVFATFAFVGLALLVLRIIARWRIFEKAGEKGWKAIIPFYSDYIFYKIIDMVPFFWTLLIGGVVVGAAGAATGSTSTMTFGADGSFSMVSAETMNPFAGLLSFAFGVFAIVTAILAAVRLARVFKKGGGYIAGLILVPDIFLMILGFGKAKYDKKALKK